MADLEYVKSLKGEIGQIVKKCYAESFEYTHGQSATMFKAGPWLKQFNSHVINMRHTCDTCDSIHEGT